MLRAMESTQIWVTTHRGIEIEFWRAGARWFALAPGQDCTDHGHLTLVQALEAAEMFIDSLQNASTRFVV